MNFRFTLTACLCLILSATAFAKRPPIDGYTGQMNGLTYFVFPNEGSDRLGAAWDPEKSAFPLSTTSAISAARTSLKRLVGTIESRFVCVEIKLCPILPGDEYWVYVVTFSSDYQAVAIKSEDGVRKSTLPFVVYFDGFVVAPWPMTR
jgi:hypothetical protein